MKNYLRRQIAARKNYKQLLDAIKNRNIIGRHPLSIQIQTFSACNAKCHFCPYQESWQKNSPGKMSDAVYSKIINEISRFQIAKFCPYLENEPLMDPKIFDKIEFALSKIKPMVLEISTNASLLNKQKLDRLIDIFPNIKHEIWISFHGIDEETFNSIMGLDFTRCKENVLALVEAAQNHNLNVIIRGAGIARLQRDRMPTWFSEKEYHNFWNNEFKRHAFKKLPEIRFFTYHDRAGQIKRNEINFSKAVRPNLNSFYCHRFDQWAHFLYSGEMILCCMDYHKATVFANIIESSLDKIYQSESFMSLLNQCIGKIPSPDDFICKKCISPWDGEYRE